MCLAGTVVASWSLTQEVASSSPFTVMTNIFCHWIQWKHLGKTQLCVQTKRSIAVTDNCADMVTDLNTTGPISASKAVPQTFLRSQFNQKSVTSVSVIAVNPHNLYKPLANPRGLGAARPPSRSNFFQIIVFCPKLKCWRPSHTWIRHWNSSVVSSKDSYFLKNPNFWDQLWRLPFTTRNICGFFFFNHLK